MISYIYGIVAAHPTDSSSSLHQTYTTSDIHHHQDSDQAYSPDASPLIPRKMALSMVDGGSLTYEAKEDQTHPDLKTSFLATIPILFSLENLLEKQKGFKFDVSQTIPQQQFYS